MTQDDPKRKFQRKRVQVEIRVRDEAGAGEIGFDMSDLSLGGAFLSSDLLLELDEILAIEIPIPNGLPLHLKARVVRAVRADDRPGMGIAFIDVNDALHASLQTLLAA